MLHNNSASVVFWYTNELTFISWCVTICKRGCAVWILNQGWELVQYRVHTTVSLSIQEQNNKSAHYPEDFSEQDVPFIQNIPFDFVQFFAKKATRFEIQAALFSSSKWKSRKQHITISLSAGQVIQNVLICTFHFPLRSSNVLKQCPLFTFPFQKYLNSRRWMLRTW